MARTRQRIFTGTVIRSPMKKTTGEGKGADTVPLKRREAALTHAQHEPDGDEDEGRGGDSEAVLGVADVSANVHVHL